MKSDNATESSSIVLAGDPLPDPAPEASSSGENESFSETRWGQALLIGVVVTLVAFLVRLAYLLEYRQDPTFHLYILDTQYNDTLAREIASGQGAPPHPYFRTPGYTYFLGMLRMIFPEGMFGIRFVQVVIGAVSCGLTGVLGARMFSRPVGWIAGSITAFYGPLIVVAPELLSPVVTIFLNVAMLLCLVEGLRSRRLGWWGAAGLLTGLSAIVRPDVLPVFGVMILFLALAMKFLRGNLMQFAAFALACAIPLSVTATRNYIVGNEFVLIGTQGGVNFFIGNNPESDGTSVEQPGKTTWGGGWEDTKDDAEKEAGRSLTFGEASSHFFRKGLASYVEAPGAMLRLNLRKLLYFWHGNELPNNKDEYASKYYSKVAAVTYWHRGLFFPFGLVGPLLLAACIWCWKGDHRSRLLIVYVGAYCLAVIAFFVTGRYRLPIIPAAAILIALLAVEVTRLLRKPGGAVALLASWRFRGALAVMVAGIIFLNTPIAGAEEIETRSAYQTMKGISLMHLGRFAEAIEPLERAIKENPTSNRAAVNNASVALASAYQMTGNLPAAEGMYRQILSRHPENSTMMTWLGETLMQQGRAAEALPFLEGAVKLDPHLATVHTALAAALMELNDLPGAHRHFLEADRLAPDPDSKTNLGMYFGRTGNYPAARKHFEEALQLNPGFEDAHVGIAMALNGEGRIAEAHDRIRAVLKAPVPSPKAQMLAAQWGVRSSD